MSRVHSRRVCTWLSTQTANEEEQLNLDDMPSGTDRCLLQASSNKTYHKVLIPPQEKKKKKRKEKTKKKKKKKKKPA